MAGRTPEKLPNSDSPVSSIRSRHNRPIREAFETHVYNPRKDLLLAKNIKPALDAISIDSKYIGIYTDMQTVTRKSKK